MEGGQALLEGADEGLYPVVAQHHALREAEVELLHGSQRGDVGASAGDQQLQQLQEFLLDSVCEAARSEPGPSPEHRPRMPTGDRRLPQGSRPRRAPAGPGGSSGLTRLGSVPPSPPGPVPPWPGRGYLQGK